MSKGHYNFISIEKKWQEYWEKNKTFKAEINPTKKKFYCLDMFPYPSGSGLHIGHPEGYTATDIFCRYKRMKGFNVLHPMGWDAFGLPAENYALKTGTHPAETTQKNIENFTRQIKSLGFSYDWDREVNTTDPSYYKWTQWIFLQLYKKGLAYEAEMPINWCTSCKVGLANEEVKEGTCERCGARVTRKNLKQWMLKITAYADRLLKDLDELDWPEAIKEQQRNWIGRSEGAQVTFVADHSDQDPIEIFTSRPDTLFGATFMVLAPEHPLVEKLTTVDQKEEVAAYIEKIGNKSDLDRTDLSKDKTGVFTGAYAINPVNQKKIPIWIADYVLMSYGTGAIMSVPGHDTRDYEFAKKFDLEIVEVVAGGDLSKEAFVGEGKAINSDFIDGLGTSKAKSKMIEHLEKEKIGKRQINYKLRDWVFSRQRYWGEPFPIIHTEEGAKVLDESELPLMLPETNEYKPSNTGESPLANITSWVETTDPETGKKARRETNTMPQWAGSCWYYLRYIDPQNDKSAWSEESENYWLPVDLYVGGAEHAVLHLLYSRFWHKVLYDLGHVHTKEPFQRLVNQGLILGYTYRCFVPTDKAKPVYRHKEVVEKEDSETGMIQFYSKENGEKLKERVFSFKEVYFDAENVPHHPEFKEFRLDEIMEKMSKTRGNVINPDDVIETHGADSLRLFEMFMGPLEIVKPWSPKGVDGVYKFLNRVWRLFFDKEGKLKVSENEELTEEQLKVLHKTIDQVTKDTENMRFNTAISRMMEFVNAMTKMKAYSKELLEPFILLLSPYAPHLCEEIWEAMGNKETLSYEPWPKANPEYLKEDRTTFAVQVNGKMKGTKEMEKDLPKEEVEKQVKEMDKVKTALEGKTIHKVIVVPNKLINFVAR